MDADERDGLLMGSRGFRGSAALLHKQIMTERLQRQTSSNQEEAYQTEEGQSQRTLMEMQLRQLLFEYGQAQETIEENRPQRSRKRRGPSAVKAALQQEKQVGRLALMAGAASWQGNKDVQEDRRHDIPCKLFLDGPREFLRSALRLLLALLQVCRALWHSMALSCFAKLWFWSPLARLLDAPEFGIEMCLEGLEGFEELHHFQDTPSVGQLWQYLLDLELESREGTKIAGFLVLDGHSGSLCCDHLMERLPGNLQIHGFGRKEEILYMTG
eukprot:s2496_g15.t2